MHEQATRPILVKKAVQKLIAYLKVSIPKKRLYVRQAAIFTSTAKRIAEDFLSRPREKSLLDFLLLSYILGIALEEGKLELILYAFPGIYPAISSSYSQERLNILNT